MKLKYRAIERFRGQYSVDAVCRVFEVSHSGYYAWRKRQEKAAKDQWLVDLVVECQRLCKQTYGIRRVQHWIQRKTGKVVNIKAIFRVMRKLSLLSVIRHRRPYIRYKQAVHKYVARADCIFTVYGNSMEPEFRSGQDVLVQRIPNGSDLKSGEIGAFISGNENYIKEYQEDGMHSLNPDYKPMHFSESDSVYLSGRVLSILDKAAYATAEDISKYEAAHGEG